MRSTCSDSSKRSRASAWSIPRPSYSRRPRPAADAADDFALRAEEGVEHVYVFGDPHRVMPRQDRHHGAEVHALRDAGDIGQVLQRIGDHRVGREVVLDGPHRVEAGVVGDARDVDLLAEDVAIRARRMRRDLLAALLGLVTIPVGVVLVENGGAYAHGKSLPCCWSR